MTFKGAKYETILEIWQLITANEYLLKCRELELEHMRKVRSPDLNQSEVRVNLTKNFVQALHDLQEDLVDKIDQLSATLSDLETQIFLKKFIIGESNEKIMEDLSISSSNLYRHFDHINLELESTTHGKELLEVLKNTLD